MVTGRRSRASTAGRDRLALATAELLERLVRREIQRLLPADGVDEAARVDPQPDVVLTCTGDTWELRTDGIQRVHYLAAPLRGADAPDEPRAGRARYR